MAVFCPPYENPCGTSIPLALHCVAVASAHAPVSAALPVLSVAANVLGISLAEVSLHVVAVNAVHVQSVAVALALVVPIALAYKSVPSIHSVAASTAHD